MNNDRISNTPGGDLMLVGGIAFAFAVLAFHALRHEVGSVGQFLLIGLMLFGAVQFGRGIWAWKYTDHEAFVAERRNQNLYVDLPLEGRDMEVLYQLEDSLLAFIRTSKKVKINLHSVDTANNIGTIHLSGREADAIFAQVYVVLGYFAYPAGIHLYPKPGQPVDPEIKGKRVLLASLKR